MDWRSWLTAAASDTPTHTHTHLCKRVPAVAIAIRPRVAFVLAARTSNIAVRARSCPARNHTALSLRTYSPDDDIKEEDDDHEDQDKEEGSDDENKDKDHEDNHKDTSRG